MGFKKDVIIWMIIIAFIIVIFGIYLSKYTPLDLLSTRGEYEPSPLFDFNANEVANKINENIQENFNNPTIQEEGDNQMENFKEESTSTQVEAGASQYYKWGHEKDDVNFSIDMPDNGDYSSFDYEWKSPEWSQNTYTGTTYRKKKSDKCEDKKEKSEREICYECDITANKDIDKYVLKSSIPPCPDMANYVTKNQMLPEFNPNEWVKKNEIAPCPKVDLSQYVLKSEIPACPPQVTCPECPICPVCPEIPKCKTINEFQITEHPDMKDYIKKSDVLNSDIVKKYIQDNFVEKSKCLTTQNKIVTEQNQQQYQQPQQPQQQPQQQDNSQYSQYNMGDVQGLYAGDSLFATVQ